ncbi:MAG: nucleotidyl transferase AbiEii/AbiGii toxin family protein [Desulfobulbaceae bacterium]|nr:nucleotidyl transferase AbiEii/AbiGii toxin family protein [Desulfobulbaceae bacterium]
MIEIIQQKLDSCHASNPVEEEQATKEIMQEIALYGLWRAGFFEVAAFQGGTSLRILHHLPRFSEDLDFMLQMPDPEFDWSPYLSRLLECFEEYGLQSEALPKGSMDRAVRTAVLKNSSFVSQLNLQFYRGHADRKIAIKLEVDANPPVGSGFDYTYLDFPTDFEVCHQNLPSNFALKIHALLCRPYLKGRDWYDFNWYIRQDVSPNVPHLQNALIQYGPWKGQEDLVIDEGWVRDELQKKIDGIEWAEAAADVAPFLKLGEQESLKLWDARFFSAKLKKLA